MLKNYRQIAETGSGKTCISVIFLYFFGGSWGTRVATRGPKSGRKHPKGSPRAPKKLPESDLGPVILDAVQSDRCRGAKIHPRGSPRETQGSPNKSHQGAPKQMRGTQKTTKWTNRIPKVEQPDTQKGGPRPPKWHLRAQQINRFERRSK